MKHFFSPLNLQKYVRLWISRPLSMLLFYSHLSQGMLRLGFSELILISDCWFLPGSRMQILLNGYLKKNLVSFAQLFSWGIWWRVDWLACHLGRFMIWVLLGKNWTQWGSSCWGRFYFSWFFCTGLLKFWLRLSSCWLYKRL